MDLNELTIWFMLMIFHLKLQILTAALKFTFGSWFRFRPLLSGAVFRIRWHEIAYSKPKRLSSLSWEAPHLPVIRSLWRCWHSEHGVKSRTVL